MRFCTHCGSDLGQSQAFCVNCGTPVSTDVATSSPAPTAALPLTTPPTPWPSSSAASVPPPPPSYAAASIPPPPTPSYPPLPPPAPWVDTHQAAPGPREAPASAPWDEPAARRRKPASILAVAIVVLLLAIGGGVYLLTKPDNATASGKTGGRGTGISPSVKPSISAPTSRPTTDPTTDPSVTPTAPAGPTQDLTATLAASAPTQAKDNVDAANNPVSYNPQNMVDGVGSTCWRTPGDATGQTLTFTLPTASVITSVGLINGYAKIDPTSSDDRYVQERRITAVTWIFDDGTNVPELLSDGVRTMQSVSVPGTNVQSRTVRLRIDGTTSPGSTLDFTAVSDVSVQGR